MNQADKDWYLQGDFSGKLLPEDPIYTEAVWRKTEDIEGTEYWQAFHRELFFIQ